MFKNNQLKSKINSFKINLRETLSGNRITCNTAVLSIKIMRLPSHSYMGRVPHPEKSGTKIRS